MNYNEIYSQVQQLSTQIDTSSLKNETLTGKLVITGEAGGEIYASLVNGVLSIDDHGPANCDFVVTTTTETLQKLMDGEMSVLSALMGGTLKTQGNLFKLIKIVKNVKMK